MKWRLRIISFIFLALVGCGKNDGIRTVGGGFYSPSGPSGAGPYGGGPANGGPMGGGSFFPNSGYPYGPGFYPWAPIYGYYQQNPVLQPVFIILWNGWQNYAYSNQIPVYSFTQFWYQYCPQVMSTQLYQYFSNNFYPWMTPTTTFTTGINPQLFWQNYIGLPYSTSCSFGCY